MNKKTRIYYIIGVLNDRISNVYGYQFISIDDIFDDITRLKKGLKKIHFGIFKLYLYI